jgi:hypothetical protein
MFLRSTTRKKDGKEHRYFSVVENRRLSSGKTAQRTVLYLGEVNDRQERAWRKTLEVFDEAGQSQRLSLFPEDRALPADTADSLQVKLSGLELQRPRAYGNCWLACELWRQLGANSIISLKITPNGARPLGWLSRIAIHPALQRTDLGWATIIDDTQPRDKEKFSSLIGDTNYGRLIKTGWIPDDDGRRISDVPISIVSDGRRLMTVHTARLPDRDELARSVFISMSIQPADGKAANAEFSKVFLSVMPYLIQRSYNYDRLNQFVSVLAIMRWAKSEGATFKPHFDRPKGVSTPPAVFHNNEIGYVPVADFERSVKLGAECNQMAVRYKEAELSDKRKWLTPIAKYCGDRFANAVQIQSLFPNIKPPGM